MRLWIIFFCVLSSVALADFNKALDAYTNERYEEAYSGFTSLAELGEKQSQFNLGVMYYRGEFVEKNLIDAYAWIKLALEDDVLDESLNDVLTIIEEELQSQDKGLELAQNRYKELFNNFGTDALAEKLYPKTKIRKVADNNIVPIEIVQPNYPRKAVMGGLQGYVRYSFNLDKSGRPRNIFLLDSFPEDVFVRDSSKVIPRWRFKIQNKELHDPNEFHYYTMEFKLANAGGIKPKINYYTETKKEAEKGDIDALFQMGLIAQYFSGVPEHGTHGLWYLEAAKRGQIHAQYRLGKSLLNGDGCELDKGKAISWLTLAASKGQVDARGELGKIYANKTDLKSHRLAIQYLNDAREYDKSYFTHYQLVKLLLETPFEELQNYELAEKVEQEINWFKLRDPISEYEIKAMIAFTRGDYEDAIDYQEEALEEAEDEGYYTNDIAKKLGKYRSYKKQAAL